jgi:hypothetical protein
VITAGGTLVLLEFSPGGAQARRPPVLGGK